MPELPDVELARRHLRRWMRGATITAAHSDDRHIFRPRSPSTLRRALVGRTVREIDRRGKWLRIQLDDGARLFSHLGMTGGWERREIEAAKERSERARIDLMKGAHASSVRYIDSRRFGRLIVGQEDIVDWHSLGPDPLVDGIRAASLARELGKSRRAIKDVLMDQSILAGIGNILATEGLWHARIDPRSPSDALSAADVRSVVRGLRLALREELATRAGPESRPWQDEFSVYGHTGEPCPRCRTVLSRVVIGGRTSTFCPQCQIRRR